MSTLGRGAPDYTVTVRGSRYVAESRVNLEPLRNTSLNQLWLDINADHPSPVIQFAAGTFTVDAPLVIEAIDTAILGMGPQCTFLELDDGVDDDMIQMSTYYHNFQLKHLTLDGNRAGNAAGKGVDINVADATYGGGSEYWGWFAIDDIQITECDEDGFYIRTAAGLHTQGYMDNLRVWDNDGNVNGYQGSFIRCFDQWIGGSGQNNISSLRLNSCASMKINNIYFGGGIDNLVSIEGGGADDATSGNLWSLCRFDNAVGSALRLTEGARRNLFSGCAFTNLSQTAATNTFPAVSAEGTSAYNMWFGCYFGHTNIKTDDRWSYAFQELNTSNYNQLLGCVTGYGAVLAGNAEHFATDEADLLGGSATVINGCYKQDGNVWGVV